MSQQDVRKLIRSISEGDQKQSREQLKSILQKKVIERLNRASEE